MIFRPLCYFDTGCAAYRFGCGAGQLATGAISDHIGRKWLIAAGIWVQAAGIVIVVMSSTLGGFAVGSTFLGTGTAMVCPTLLAAIGDVAHPSWRASAVGVYHLCRDLGYAVGALISGVAADLFGLRAAVWLVAALRAASDAVVGGRMQEALGRTGVGSPLGEPPLARV